jgi:23S rRNA pseudouridine1911/1915/1917 synthase
VRTFETVISEQWDQCTVEKVLRRELGLSVTRIKRAKFRPDGILLDGKRVNTVQRVSAGQVLQLNLPELEESDFVPTAGEVAIAYEDQWLMVIDKPAGLAMYPGPGHYADTLGNRFVWLMQQRGEQCAFRPVNRLDIGTSGLLVAVKSADAHEALQKILHTDAFQRTYWALTEHAPQSEQGVIDAPIAPIAGELNRYTVVADGKPAQTEYQVLRKGTAATLVQLRLFTGRTHQIRVHMAHIGCPLLGDALYGGGDGLSRPALHSKFLRLRHPFTGEWLELESATPADFRSFLEENCP